MKPQHGNALFLILIAVALFAALSYAITNSGRGSGSIDKEQAEIISAQIMSAVATYQQSINRLKVVGGYQEILFNDSDPDSNGTCFQGNTDITPCNTIGLFSPESGTIPLTFPQAMQPATYSYAIFNGQIRVSGAEVGTALPDNYLWLRPIKESVCRSINNRLHGDNSIGTATLAGANQGFSGWRYDWDTDTYVLAQSAHQGDEYNILNGGVDYNGAGSYSFYYILQEN